MLVLCVVAIIHPTFFVCRHTAAPELYTLSLHDALPISAVRRKRVAGTARRVMLASCFSPALKTSPALEPSSGSEEHTSELQSLRHLVCRLLLEKKKAMILSARPAPPPTMMMMSNTLFTF